MKFHSGARLGSYEIQSPVAEGGLGDVWKARDTDHDRDVALRILPSLSSADPERVARFEHDVTVLASLQHPNIATVHGLVDVDNVQALAFEWVVGQSLAERLAQGRMEISEALSIASATAEALGAAHRRAIVHGDIKPSNVK